MDLCLWGLSFQAKTCLSKFPRTKILPCFSSLSRVLECLCWNFVLYFVAWKHTGNEGWPSEPQHDSRGWCVSESRRTSPSQNRRELTQLWFYLADGSWDITFLRCWLSFLDLSTRLKISVSAYIHNFVFLWHHFILISFSAAFNIVS